MSEIPSENSSANIVHAIVPEALDGERVDRVVAVFADVTRAEATTLVENGSVHIGGVVVTRRSTRVHLGNEISIVAPERTKRQGLAPDPSVVLDVIYEDDSIAIINKNADLVVHPGAGNQTGTLVHGLLARYPEIAVMAVGDQAERPGIVHRLDKGTSGLLMVGRTQQAVTNLIAQLSARTVSRHYMALAHGRFASRSGVIDAAVGRSDSDPTKMTVTANGKEAVTHYRVDRSFDLPEPATLVECWLETGRTHQIRVHMSAIGHPLVGDPRYGGMRGPIRSPRLWLHAFSLSFLHPTTGEHLTFEAPVPDDLSAVFDQLTEVI
jgi:23S rRNA pseudouridine1911/1915/1917 synthase